MIRILLVNEIPLMGNVIASVLEDEPGITVLGCATTVEQALERAVEADVVLVSTRLPQRGALKITQTLASAQPPVKVLVFGLTESKAQILHYVQAGAAGYVLKDDSVEKLVAQIRSAYNDQALVSPEIAAALMTRLAELAQMSANVAIGQPSSVDLTPREHEILELIAEDLTNRQIAERLVIKVGTVKNHVHSILQKLEVQNREDAASCLALMG